jgi:hypothetical protein
LQSLLSAANEQINSIKSSAAKTLEDSTSSLKKSCDLQIQQMRSGSEFKIAQLENNIARLNEEKQDLLNQVEELIMMGGTAAEGHAELQAELMDANTKLQAAEEERNGIIILKSFRYYLCHTHMIIMHIGAKTMLHAAKEEIEVLKLKTMDAAVATAALQEAAQVTQYTKLKS